MQTIENHLTPRLEMILSLVPKSSSVCDIGTDHGYVPIALFKKDLAEKVIAMDINEGPLSQAQKNIDAFSLSSKIETRLSDGFSNLSYGEADTAIIAGMGGELIARIMRADKGVKRFVLQPQTMHRELREFLYKNGYFIEKEDVCRETRKMYVAMLVVKKESHPLSRVECEIGPYLISHRPPLLEDYVRYRLYEIESILKKMGLSETNKKEEYLYLKAEYERLIENG